MKILRMLEKKFGKPPSAQLSVVVYCRAELLGFPPVPGFEHLPHGEQLIAWVRSKGWHAEYSPDGSMVGFAPRPDPKGPLFRPLRPASGLAMLD